MRRRARHRPDRGRSRKKRDEEHTVAAAGRWGRFQYWTIAGWSVAFLCLLLGVLIWVGLKFGYVRWIYRDGDAIWDSRDRLNVRSVLWSPPEEIHDRPGARQDETVVGTIPSSAPRLLVALKTAAGTRDIFVRHLTPQGWTGPTLLGGEEAAFHSPHDEIAPTLSHDGTLLLFASNRPGGFGGFDLYASRFADGAWSPPRALGSQINSPFDDVGATLHPSRRLIVFATNRPRGFLFAPPTSWDDVPLENWQAADFELAYAIAPPDGSLRGWSEPQPLASLVTERDEERPAFSPSGTFLYFSSSRDGGFGSRDLYRSRCRLLGLDPNEVTTLQVDSPENIGPPVNTRLDDSAPQLLLEGFGLAYEVRDPKTGASFHFESRSHEVAPELSVAAVPIDAVTQYLLQVGGLALGAVVLFILTLVLMRYRRLWAMNLYARCAVVAVLLHVGLLYVFYFWQIGSQLAQVRAKTVLAEVTIEKTLQARLTQETQRIKIELPDQDPLDATVEPQPTLRDSPMLADPSALDVAVERVAVPQFEKVQPFSNATTARVDTSLPPVPFERRQDPIVEQLRPDALATVAAEADTLPAPESSPASDEVDATTPVGVGLSLKVAAETPRPGPVGTVVETVPSLATEVRAEQVQQARTQVQAPALPPKVLPPLTHAATTPTEELVSSIPVPAQSADREAELSLAPRAEATRSEASARPTPPQLETSAPPLIAAVQPQRRWHAPAVGTEAVTSPEARFQRSPLPPPRAQPSEAATQPQMPETAALAERRQEAVDENLRVEPAELDAVRRWEPAAGDEVARAELLSQRDVSQARPAIAPADGLNAVQEASPATLSTSPAPGSLVDSAVASSGPLRAPQTDLPDGERSQKPGEGSDNAADLIGAELSPAARTKLEVSRQSGAPPAPPAVDARREPVAGDSAPLTADASTPSPTEVATAEFLRPLEPVPGIDAPARKRLPERRPQKRMSLSDARSEESRKVLVPRMGGTAESELAVRLALEWLAACQSEDGRWDVDGFLQRLPDSGAPGFHTQCDAAVTGLAVLSFLGQNHTHVKPDSPYRMTVLRALRWLLSIQTESGLLSGSDQKYIMYNHGIATLALSEAYILSRDERLLPAIEKAARIIVEAQNPNTGGWRYLPVVPLRGDTSVSGWQVMALTSIHGSALKLPGGVFDRARHWFDVEVSSGQHRGIYGYSKPEEPRVAMVAEGMFARQLLGARRGDDNIEEAARYIHTETRRRGYLDNLYLVYYGTLALYQYQGWIWERWNTEVRDYLVKSQNRSGARRGSWDPTGPWSEAGGQVLATCFATLSLEVYYRYLPLYWQATPTSETAQE